MLVQWWTGHLYRAGVTNSRDCVQKLRQLTCYIYLAALSGKDSTSSICTSQKLISDSLLRQHNSLMINGEENKSERPLALTKQIFNYYNTNSLLEMWSKVENIQKYTFTHNGTTSCSFRVVYYSLAQFSRNHRIMEYHNQFGKWITSAPYFKWLVSDTLECFININLAKTYNFKLLAR